MLRRHFLGMKPRESDSCVLPQLTVDFFYTKISCFSFPFCNGCEIFLWRFFSFLWKKSSASCRRHLKFKRIKKLSRKKVKVKNKFEGFSLYFDISISDILKKIKKNLLAQKKKPQRMFKKG